MPDYKKGKIYIMYSNVKNILPYIGSTVQTLPKRNGGHRDDFRRYKLGKRGRCSSFSILETGDYRIELLEEYSCENKMQLLKREGYWQKKLECCNYRIAGRNRKEYEKDNKEKIQLYQKKYQIDNKDILVEKSKKYREANKEKINERKREKIICELCGATATRCHLRRHQRTKTCKNNRN